MADKVVVQQGGTSIVGLLGITFVVLKLCGVIDWPWIWVLCPFWIGLVIVLGIVAFVILATIVITALK